MEFKEMDAAVQFIKNTLRIENLSYQYGSYSYGEKGQLTLVADHKGDKVIIRPEINCRWYDNDKRVKTYGPYLATLAVLKLFADGFPASAKRLATLIASSVHKVTFELERETDWHIVMALAYYGITTYFDNKKNRAECSITANSLVPPDYLECVINEISVHHHRVLETEK